MYGNVNYTLCMYVYNYYTYQEYTLHRVGQKDGPFFIFARISFVKSRCFLFKPIIMILIEDNSCLKAFILRRRKKWKFYQSHNDFDKPGNLYNGIFE